MGVGVGVGVGAGGGVGVAAGAGEGVVGASEDDSQPMATSEKARHPVTAKRRIMRTATSSRQENKELSIERGPARVNWNRAGTRDGRNRPGVSAEGSRSTCPVPPG